ncbi:MAG: hypothetical protein AB7O24_09450 [Kofleriaceae bacterium]
MRWWFGLGIALVGCGSSPTMPDATPDAPGPRCDPNAAFGAPVLVPTVNSDLDESTARLSPDELRIMFARRNSGGTADLWFAVRARIEDPFDEPQLITTVNSISSDLNPSSPPSELVLLYDTDRMTPGTYRIWTSKRSVTTATFGPPSIRPEMMDNEIHPMFANDSAVYFASSSRGGLGARDIFRANIASDGVLSEFSAVVGDVNSVANEDFPAVSQDERRIAFRRVVGTSGDVFIASRSTPQDGFGTASPVQGLSDPIIEEAPTWLSADGCHLYVHSNAAMDGVPLGYNLWMVTRAAPSS